MFRLWAKIFKDNRMLQDTCIADESADTRTHKVFHALDEICRQFDLSKPVWLDKNISDFKNKVFDAQKARKILQGNQLEDLVISRIEQQQFITDRLSRPPIMPNAGQMYLMAISGAGQGRVGTEEAKDQHLQRGIVMNVEEAEVRQDEEGSSVVAVQKFTRISFQIVENNGVIHTL